MAKSSVASKAADAESIPLADIEIMWQREAHFIGEGDTPQPVTIAGEELGAVLRWMSRRAPGRPTQFDDPECVADTIRGLGDICLEISEGGGHSGRDLSQMLGVLGEILDDYAHRLEGRVRDMPDELRVATVRRVRAGKVAA